ncbi:Zinc finger PHD-type [Penicillium taxi]|uniref:Zinc finger PHD-type n=1 Tax=Penicillium taxi TaxID=168475 RepID=UPI002544F5DC|nr:Zinc finger PHD-type [Penicillium taxi]KAJ5887868.1 Zinc finger PHD-type [Penicillium taxi]
MGPVVGANHVNGFKIADTPQKPSNPYGTNPDKIPRDDPFLAQSAHYGRYTPHPDDFTPHHQHWYQSDPDANPFWTEVAQKFCIPEHSLNINGPRQAFAVGSVIIRIDRELVEGPAVKRFSCVNANELSAARKVEEALKELGVAIPVVYFCGTIGGRNMTVESRIPGVSLDVAWRYLNAKQIDSLKNQCRRIIQTLATVDPALDEPSYVCRGLNSQPPLSGEEKERKILFAEKIDAEDFCLVHNDLIPRNIIVNDGRVVGVAGWRQSGYFGLERVKQIHQSLRDTTVASQENTTWVDLYDEAYDAEKSVPLMSAKTEPTITSLEKFPDSDELDTKLFEGGSDYPTSKKLTDLKNELPSRGATKKGTAKKPVTKKRKVNDDTESIRSNTPLSRTSKTPGKKQDSISIAGSPVPENKNIRRKKRGKGRLNEGDDDDEDENQLFCICRRPDNHTWMIGCDGDCEDWYHGKCVNIDPRDAELIDRYICPSCSDRGKGCTTWKPMCRLLECRKPARATRKPPSKYCSDEHGQEFMRRQTRHLKLSGPGDLGSMGGILTASDLKAALMGVASFAEFRKLGDRIISPSPQSIKAETPKEETPNGIKKETTSQDDSKSTFDIDVNGMEYSADEAVKIEKLQKWRAELLQRKDMLAARSTFVSLLRQRAKAIVEKLKQNDPKGGWKDICGFDSRLSWSDDEFDEWRLSEAGQKALKEGTVEALAASYPGTTDADGDTAMDDEQGEIAVITQGVCTKKRCERHKQWVKVQQQDILFEENTTDEDLAKYEQEARSVAESAVLKKWAEMENAPP